MELPDDTRGSLLANVAPGDNSPALTVSELSGALKRTIENAFGQVRVRGEISGFKRHASGHCYFTLKDENACIDAVIWRTSAGTLAFRPEDGAEVIATGKLTIYPGRSKYQIVVDRIELAGEGALLALLERRRKALAAEGLFDPARKRKLPFLPRIIGVVTSPTGAVIRDILHRLEDRCPTHVILWPVAVQGEGAAARIAEAIRNIPGIEPRPELLIVARGGGSIEDLWPFNEEEVVRAAAESTIPLISAVGHETDTTLIDHAADLRAPTPTAAAEIAVPVRSDLLTQLGELQHRAQHCLSRRIERSRERYDLTVCRWPEPQAIFAPMAQRMDELGERLPRVVRARISTWAQPSTAVAWSITGSRGGPSSTPPPGRWPSWSIRSGRCRRATYALPAATAGLLRTRRTHAPRASCASISATARSTRVLTVQFLRRGLSARRAGPTSPLSPASSTRRRSNRC